MSMLSLTNRKQQLQNAITNAIATTTVLISIILLAINSGAAAPTTAVNAREFDLLCTLVRAEENLEERQTAGQAAKEVVALAAKIELILANLKHIERLAAAEPQAAPKESTSDETPEACKAAKSTVCNKAAQIYKKFRPDEKRALAFLAETTDKLSATVNVTLKQIADNKANHAAYFGESTGKRPAFANVKKALYGDPAVTGDGIIDTGDNTRPKACGNTASAAAKSGKARAEAALICLRGSDSSNGGNAACFTGAALDTNYGSPSNDFATAWTQIKQQCSQKQRQAKVTGEQLKTAASALNHLVHSKHGDKAVAGLLGYAEANTGAISCDGSTGNGKGSCVILSTSANSYKVETPDWLTAMQETINNLDGEKHEIEKGWKAEAHTLALNSSLTTLLALQAGSSKEAAPEKQASPEKQSNPQKDCTKNTKKKDCKEGDGCKWEDKEKNEGDLCKPKDGEGQTNAGTGETRTGVDCSKHQIQKACEAENKYVKPGQKVVCGYIVFVDGTGKLPKPKCRSLIFLVNKKLAMMTTGFVSLPFLNF
uniref:Variant surface glycoprotein (VSG, atypical), putative n=1 Tax=Trypanosoma brucei brucei (strain 927/4 GUTat10.1) TaxID=185431 RepID=Q4FKL1_TRYB2|nr:variant surface glycoprotein (VSG, atypical), putative [Trypanosoma brucei brucei TREU927]